MSVNFVFKIILRKLFNSFLKIIYKSNRRNSINKPKIIIQIQLSDTELVNNRVCAMCVGWSFVHCDVIKNFSQESNNEKLKQEEHDDNTKDFSIQIQARNEMKTFFLKSRRKKTSIGVDLKLASDR